MAILAAGGAGYIGNHTCVELLTTGYDIVIVDNLYNSSEKTLGRVEKITGRKAKFYETDPLNRPALKEVFDEEKTDLIIHFAGLKVVGESVRKPLEYYHNNITDTLILCDEMRNHGVKNIVLSSSATMYRDPAEIPITESYPKEEITDPYKRTKGMLEQILTDLHTADPEWSVVLLRYLNPIGAHENGLTGEGPRGVPNNLVSYIAQMAAGRLDHLSILGGDYDTPDSTGVGDYVHTVDLTKGHVEAVQKLQDKGGVSIYNLGTDVGYSVLDILHAYEKTHGRMLKYEIQPHRGGDVATCYSDSAKAKRRLGWVAEKGTGEMCADSWKRQPMNSNGYRDQRQI